MIFKNKNIQKGITILEFLVLLIVIGLIIAGVLLKRSIEHQARIRDEIVHITKYEIAFNDFKIKYEGLPGDLINAKSFWGDTVSGNGDYTIRTLEGRFSDEYTYGGEMSRVFEQLSLSGFLNEKYDSSIKLGVGIPTSKLNDRMGMSMYNGSEEEVSINVFYGNSPALPSLEKADEPSITTGDISGFLTRKEVMSLSAKLKPEVYHYYCGAIGSKEWCRYWYIMK